MTPDAARSPGADPRAGTDADSPGAGDAGGEARREYAQLLRLHERLAAQLRHVRDELEAPELRALLREIRMRTGDAPREAIADVTASVEEALRTLSVSSSEAHAILTYEGAESHIDGIGDLPGPLARFIAERTRMDGFTYQVLQDEVRGWIVRWREHTADGSIRGFGQFYERPYAWLDD